MSDDLKSFKISDAVGRKVDRPRSGSGSAVEEVASAGFPRIEALVAAEAPDASGLGERHAQLVDLMKTGPSPKVKAGAKNAAIAYERTIDLLEHLLATKDAMQNPPEE